MSIYCTKCGSIIQEGEKFCGNCGTPCVASDSVNPQPQSTEAAQAAHHKPGIKPWVLGCGIGTVLIVAAGVATFAYYLPHKLPESALSSPAACDWVAQQIQSDLGADDPITATAKVQLPTELPDWGLLELEYEDVVCKYELDVNGDIFELSTTADFTTGLLPGSVKRIEFEDFKYPADLLNNMNTEQSQTGENTTENVAIESPTEPEVPDPGKTETNLSYTPLPQYFQGEWYNDQGEACSLDEECYLVSFDGDGITTDLNGEFVRRGSEQRHTLQILATESGVLYIDGERFTSEKPQDDYILPDSNQRYLTEADLESLTHQECCLARNEIYARHGRKFTTEEIASYFEEKDWYQGTIEPQVFDRNTSLYFNDYELKNVQLLQQYEKEKFGGSYY